MPCSLALNAVLLALVLVMLASPCTISGRKCVYHRTDVATTTGAGSVVLAAEKIKDGDPSGLKLLSEVKGVVPEFKLEKVTFMNDSRYANERMFTDRVEHQKILDQWEADVPGELPPLVHIRIDANVLKSWSWIRVHSRQFHIPSPASIPHQVETIIERV